MKYVPGDLVRILDTDQTAEIESVSFNAGQAIYKLKGFEDNYCEFELTRAR